MLSVIISATRSCMLSNYALFFLRFRVFKLTHLNFVLRVCPGLHFFTHLFVTKFSSLFNGHCFICSLSNVSGLVVGSNVANFSSDLDKLLALDLLLLDMTNCDFLFTNLFLEKHGFKTYVVGIDIVCVK